MKRALAVGIAFALAALAAAPHASARESMTPNSATFAQEPVGNTSATQAFTLRVQCQEDPANPGTCQMTTPFSPTFAVTGDFVLVSENCPATLPGDTFFGTSCQIQVAFAPKSAGLLTGILTTGSDFARSALSGTSFYACPASTGSTCGGPATPVRPAPVKPKKCKKPKKRAGAAAKECKRKKKRA